MDALSLTGKKWQLSQARDSAQLVQDLYRERGLDTAPPTPEFTDMPKAVRRIKGAIAAAENVAIFGDYDCDGVTATAQLARYFLRAGHEPIIRLPHRVQDGYGLNTSVIQELAEQGVSLLITVDTGISSTEEIAQANKLGIDTVVTDHHEVPGGALPAAYAIIHPVKSTSVEPHPAGAGVAYLLVANLEGQRWEGQEVDTALAMMGTVADLVPLVGFNRKLVQRGLKAFAQTTYGPLMQLRESTNSKTSTDIAFRIAPRLNAAGRLSDPELALRALLEGGAAVAELDELNTKRQAEMNLLCDEVMQTMPSADTTPLLWSAEAHYAHGLVGLIAGRLTEKYGKPSCIVTIDGEECTASLRSPPCYHIAHGLERCSTYLTKHGGHAQAAGCSFGVHNLNAFHHALAQDIAMHTSPADLVPVVHIDAVLPAETVTMDLCEALSALEPFGQGNPEPRFLLRNVHLQAARTVGEDGAHLQGAIGSKKAIGWRLGEYLSHANEMLDVVCRIQVNEWQGNREPQLVIEDLRIAEPAALPVH